MKILDLFLKYVSINSQSNPDSDTFPSTAEQMAFANILAEDLKNTGLEEVYIDSNHYVIALLPSNSKHESPTIGFIAHMDTSPDFCGSSVKPQIVENYSGERIKLTGTENQYLDPLIFTELKNYIGQTIITTDGTTLLGADDKAGIVSIISALDFLIKNPQIEHGNIKIAFTPDEEIGRGTDFFDVEKFNADWAYTIDGGEIGELQYETFNAAVAKIEIVGVSVHPGYAFEKMVNSNLLINKFIERLPIDETPSKTTGYQGFFHITSIKSDVRHGYIELLIRDHDAKKFDERKRFIQDLILQLNLEHGSNYFKVVIDDQYYNMKSKIESAFQIVELAKEAMEVAGIEPKIIPVRGGTDGARLSFMGLPCPNIFAGGHNFHGPFEFVPLESIEKARDVIINICRISHNKSKNNC